MHREDNGSGLDVLDDKASSNEKAKTKLQIDKERKARNQRRYYQK